MLWNRVRKAITFNRDVYAEVEKDESFTTAAWLIVVFASAVSAIGNLSLDALVPSLVAVVVGGVLGVLAFALGALTINLVGRKVYHVDVTFEQLVRALGLAYIWLGLAFLWVVAPFVRCCLWPLRLASVAALFVSLLGAVKEVLGLESVPAVVTVVLGMIPVAVVQFLSWLFAVAMAIPL
jgi:hypothetical protein